MTPIYALRFARLPVEVPVEADSGQIILRLGGYTIVLTRENLRQLTAEAEASEVWEPVATA